MTTRKLLAYAVQESDECTGGIVFARGPAHARQVGGSVFGNGEKDWGDATRAPWADEYRFTDIPASAMIDAGWWLECHGCGQRLDDDGQDDNGNDIALDIIGTQHRAYCSPACCNRSSLDKRRQKIIGDAALMKVCRRLLKSFPGVWLWGEPHVYVTHKNSVQQVRISFQFPGCKIGNAHYGFDNVGEEPRVSVCNGDLAAWESWRSQHAQSEVPTRPLNTPSKSPGQIVGE